jgi:hypothetical protein
MFATIGWPQFVVAAVIALIVFARLNQTLTSFPLPQPFVVGDPFIDVNLARANSSLNGIQARYRSFDET